MKKHLGALSAFLIFVMIFTLIPVKSVNATDYNSYSNSSKGWGLSSKTDHSTPGGSASSSTLKKYDAYYLGDSSKKVCYLTFDCGYEYGNTPSILDTLKKNNVKAVFFLTEHFVRTNPDLVKRMKEEGHLIGNHTSKHKRLPTLSVDSIRKELQAVENAVKECTGYELDKIMRPPEGAYSERVLKVLQDMGYTTLFWSMAWKDWDVKNQPSTTTVLDQFKKHHHNGMVPLMHVVSTADTKTLPSIIKYLKDEGYTLDRFDNYYKADPRLKIKLKDFDYTGKPAKRNLTVKTLSKGKKTISFYKKGRVKPMKNIPVSAGTYFVEVSQPATKNYRSATVKLKFKIRRATPDVTLTVKGADDITQAVSENDSDGITQEENGNDSDDIAQAVSENDTNGITQEENGNDTNGTAEAGNENNAETDNKDLANNLTDQKTLTEYDPDTIYITRGSNYSFKAVCANKKGDVEIKYFDADGHRIDKPVEVGEYSVKASVSGTKNYKKSVSELYYFVIHE